MRSISSPRRKETGDNVRNSHARTVQSLLEHEIGFIPNTWFQTDEATKLLEKKIKQGIPRPKLIPLQQRKTEMSPTLLRMCQEPLLDAEEEKELFRIMNLAKYRANQIRATLNPSRRQVRKVEKINKMLAVANAAQERIALANGRLVWSISSPMVSDLHSLDELISEGLIALARAVQKFDFSRGYRFSTYTTMVVRRHLYRYLGADQKHRTRYYPGPSEVFDRLTDYRNEYRMTENGWSEISDGTEELMESLDDREQRIIRERFGIDNLGKTRSLQNLANELGICKERVRQLEKRALRKMRDLADTLGMSDLAVA